VVKTKIKKLCETRDHLAYIDFGVVNVLGWN
jgi:hypothetical protein